MAKRTVGQPGDESTLKSLGGHAMEGLVGIVVLVAGAVITPFAMGWFDLNEASPAPPEPPAERKQAVIEKAAALTPLAGRMIRLTSEGDRADTADLAADVAPLVRSRLRAPVGGDGLSIGFRLAELDFADARNKRVDARWAIARPGKRAATCAAADISFYSTSDLAERLTDRINESIAATADGGEPICQ